MVPFPAGLGLWLGEEMAGQPPLCSSSPREVHILPVAAARSFCKTKGTSRITWANNGNEEPVFPEEPVMGGQLSLPGGDPHVSLFAPPSRSGKDASPRLGTSAGRLSSRMSDGAQSCCYEHSDAQGKGVPVGQTQPA